MAAYRATETERPDALFNDPYARRMAGERGEEIVRSLPFGRSMAWSMVVRTAVMDELILRCIDRGARTVLNLGAGLDTRAFRLELPPSLRWLDVDLPAMIDYRHACLDAETPTCEHVHVAADMSEGVARARVLEQARGSKGPLLVVSEGLLVYLTPDQVADLAVQLHTEAQARWWLADLITPLLQQTMGLVWSSQLAAAAPFQFAPADGKQFFANLGWREEAFRSTWTESIRLGRAAPNGLALDSLWKLFGPAGQEVLERMSGVALFEHASQSPSQ